MPGAVGDLPHCHLQLLRVCLRQRQPTGGAGVLARQDQTGKAKARAVDPVMPLQVLGSIPGVRKVDGDLVGLVAEARGDRRAVRRAQGLVDPVVREGDSHQHVGLVQIGRDPFTVAPVVPSQVRLQLLASLVRIGGISSDLVAERPDRDLVSLESEVVVLVGRRRRVVEVLVQDVEDVRSDLCVGRGCRRAQRGNIGRVEEE